MFLIKTKNRQWQVIPAGLLESLDTLINCQMF